MTIETIDCLLWQLLAKHKHKALRYWFAKLQAMKGPVTGWRGQR
jgi:hypothetical protein